MLVGKMHSYQRKVGAFLVLRRAAPYLLPSSLSVLSSSFPRHGAAASQGRGAEGGTGFSSRAGREKREETIMGRKRAPPARERAVGRIGHNNWFVRCVEIEGFDGCA